MSDNVYILRPGTGKAGMDVSGETATVFFDCNLDVTTVPSLREAVDLLAESQCRTILIDISRVDFIDSMGVGLFANLLRKSQKSGAKVVFCGAKRQPRSVLSLVGFDDLAAFTDCTDSAQRLPEC